jgi:hypothetical protein
MVSLSVLGNERERTSGTSANALSRTCVPLRSRIGSGPGLLVAAGFSGRVQRRNRTNASGGRIGHGRGRRHRRGQRRGDAGARQSHDACIREIASARAALPLRSPWTNSGRVDRNRADARIRLAKQAWRATPTALLQVVQLSSDRGRLRGSARCRFRERLSHKSPGAKVRRQMSRSKDFWEGSETNQSPGNAPVWAAADICDSLANERQSGPAPLAARPERK